jgi:tetratricopeptide (TPR) repeat protein
VEARNYKEGPPLKPLFKALSAAALVIGSAMPVHAVGPIAANDTVQDLWDQWGEIFYVVPEKQRATRFEAFMPRVKALVAQRPGQADPLILEAIVLCTYAASDVGLGALNKVSQARDLLVKSIGIDPKARSGAAYITLGNLYYRLPGWPISFGDEDQGRHYFEGALKLSPDGIDSNFFYGDYLLDRGEYEKALVYLEKADRAPIRSENRLSDLNVKKEIAKALASARERRNDKGVFFSRIVASVFGISEKQ